LYIIDGNGNIETSPSTSISTLTSTATSRPAVDAALLRVQECADTHSPPEATGGDQQ